MKYCGFCGAELQDGHKFCINCGKETVLKEAQVSDTDKVQESPAEACPSTEAEIFVATREYGAQASYCQAKRTSKLKYSIMGFAFGVAALFCALYCIIPILNLFMFLPAFIVFTSISKKNTRKHLELGNRKNGFCIAARVVSTVAIPVGCVFSCFSFVLLV